MNPKRHTKRRGSKDPLEPGGLMLVRLGSIAQHCDEINDYGWDHQNPAWQYDILAIQTLLRNEDLRAWLADMVAHAYVPVKRNTSRAIAPMISP